MINEHFNYLALRSLSRLTLSSRRNLYTETCEPDGWVGTKIATCVSHYPAGNDIIAATFFILISFFYAAEALKHMAPKFC